MNAVWFERRSGSLPWSLTSIQESLYRQKKQKSTVSYITRDRPIVHTMQALAWPTWSVRVSAKLNLIKSLFLSSRELKRKDQIGQNLWGILLTSMTSFPLRSSMPVCTWSSLSAALSLIVPSRLAAAFWIYTHITHNQFKYQELSKMEQNCPYSTQIRAKIPSTAPRYFCLLLAGREWMTYLLCGSISSFNHWVYLLLSWF